MKILWMILFVALLACNNNEQSGGSPDSTTSPKDTANSGAPAVENMENDSIINVRFPPDSTSVTVSGKMKGIAHPVTVYTNKAGKTINSSADSRRFPGKYSYQSDLHT